MEFQWTKTMLIAALVVGLMGLVSGDEEGLPNVGDVAAKLGVNTSNIDTEQLKKEAENALKQKCEKNGGPTAFDQARAAGDEIQACMKSLVNTTELHIEMEAAKPTGELDTVFKKYCKRSPIFKECIVNFTTSIEPCMDAQEKQNKKLVLSITEALLKFICFKEGDRIALFIAAGGPECLQSKQEKIQDCTNATFGHLIAGGQLGDLKDSLSSSVSALPSFTFSPQECENITRVQNCTVKALEECSDPTPANVVDSLFNFVKGMTPCNLYTPQNDEPAITGKQVTEGGSNSSNTLASSSLLVVILGFASLSRKLF